MSHRVVAIPAYNAESSIAEVVAGAQRHVSEVWVVDDGSSDGTARAARQAGARLLRHQHNCGKGYALVTAFNRALAHGVEQLVTMDADGQHHPDDLPGLLQAAEDADLVIGQREIALPAMPRTSFAGNTIGNFWISLFCGRQLPDTQCGYRVHRQNLMRQLPLVGGRFETETEILIRAHRLGMRLRWHPVRTIYQQGKARTTHFHNVLDPLRVIGVVLGSHHFPRREHL